MRSTNFSVPDFSSRPPVVTMTVSAIPVSAMAANVSTAAAAGMERTARSTLPGSEAKSGKQRQPSISALPGFTT